MVAGGAGAGAFTSYITKADSATQTGIIPGSGTSTTMGALYGDSVRTSLVYDYQGAGVAPGDMVTGKFCF